jgi:hypothetical protein
VEEGRRQLAEESSRLKVSDAAVGGIEVSGREALRGDASGSPEPRRRERELGLSGDCEVDLSM